MWTSMSDDGRVVGFVSAAANLINGDTNGVPDVFAHGREITLEIQPSQAQVGDTMSVVTWGGAPGNWVLTVVVAVKGVPGFLPLVPVVTFDGAGQTERTGTLTISPGVPVDFQGFAIGALGGVTVSNAVQVDFQ